MATPTNEGLPTPHDRLVEANHQAGKATLLQQFREAVGLVNDYARTLTQKHGLKVEVDVRDVATILGPVPVLEFSVWEKK